MCNTIYHNCLDKYSELIENKKIVEIANRVVTGKTPSTKNEDFWNGNIPFLIKKIYGDYIQDIIRLDMKIYILK